MPFVLIAVGIIIFFSALIYILVDKARTKVLFRDKKKMFPPVIVGWVTAMIGIAILSARG